MDSHQIISHLHLWPDLADAQVQLLNLSENHTYLLHLPDGMQRILRVHRSGYQNPASILSEIEWISALGRDAGLIVPSPQLGDDGEFLQWIGEGAQKRPAILFEYLVGHEVDESAPDLTDKFTQLGRFAAICHQHTRTWTPPAAFTRQKWSVDTMLGANGLWGDWRAAPGVIPTIKAVLDQTHAKLKDTFATYGTDKTRYGLIHADMRLANILQDGATLKLIDFDDCGYCWFIYDFAASISFMEDDPRVSTLKQAWLAGYAEEGAPQPLDVDMIDAAIMLRRMLLLAWVGSHMDAPLPKTLAPTFAKTTAELAQRFLDGHPLS